MIIYLMRHGIAVELGEFSGRGDAARPLTEEGREKTLLAARGLRALRVQPERIATSPLKRARQTADLVAETLHTGAAPEVWPSLAPGQPPAGVVNDLRRSGVESILLTGHMPDLAALALHLIAAAPAAALHFKRAGTACLVCDGPPRAGHAALEWLLPPRVLRRLADDGAH